MSQEDAFLQAILEDPDNDEARLVYADWLEERGDPRGEFIRLQCAKPNPHGMTDEMWEERYDREQVLLAKHGKQWAKPLHRLSALDFSECKVIAEDLAALGECAYLTQLQDLNLSNPYRGSDYWNEFDGEQISCLTSSPYLKRLKNLDLGFNDISDRGLSLLAQSGFASQLEDLDLEATGISPAGIRLLGSAPAWKLLRSLDLGGNRLGDIGMRTLAALSNLPRLRSLSLRQNDISAKGLNALAGWPSLPRLDTLVLDRNGFGNAGVKVIAESAGFHRLGSLELCDNEIDDQGAEFLAASPLKKQLELNLGVWIDFEDWDELDDNVPKPYRNRISADGQAALTRRFPKVQFPGVPW
jgi:uncharacterized protein (TIGR02996 family)